MTRRDYVLIANALFACRPKNEASPEYRAWNEVVATLASDIRRKTNNATFDEARFIRACEGVQS